MKYKMKTDLWIRILLWGIILMFVPFFFFVPPEEIWILGLTTFIMAVIIIPLFSASYELNEEEILIMFYFFKQRIKYDNIKSIKKCSNWRSSAAMSHERIEIKEHNKGFVRGTTYISPMDRDEFFSNLKLKCRNLDLVEKNVWDE